MMRVILCFTIGAFWMSVSGTCKYSDVFRFDYVHHEEANGWLKYHKVPTDFLTAFQKCKAEGAMLASPLTIELREAMVRLQNENHGSCPILTGVHSTFSTGDYYSIDGISMLRMPVSWAPDEPDNHENSENCTIMFKSGMIADVNCNDRFPFICFKKNTCEEVTSTCGTIDKEYFLDKRTGSCYKFHTVARTWRHASMTCNAEGGHLAIINSETEMQVLKELFVQYSKIRILSPYTFVASVGFLNWGKTGVWYTVHGQTIQEAGYSKFHDEEPTGGTYCGAVSNDGLLHDIACVSSNFAFICEKQPNSLLNL